MGREEMPPQSFSFKCQMANVSINMESNRQSRRAFSKSQDSGLEGMKQTVVSLQINKSRSVTTGIYLFSKDSLTGMNVARESVSYIA
jgi:hypothetical protein